MINKHYLVADIGGTNVRFAISSYHEIGIQQKSYKCANFPSLQDAISQYLSEIPKIYKLKSALIAVAAAVAGDSIVVTNNHWVFSQNSIKNYFNFADLKVVNDFEAQAFAVEYLQSSDIICIKEAINNLSDNRRVIAGPGTGFGASLLLKIVKNWQVVSTEIGHTSIGSYNKEEQDIFDIIKDKKGFKESYGEMVVSGPGIMNIYNALCLQQNIQTKYLTSEDIVINMKSDSLCKKTIDLFFTYLGTLTSNIALAYLPYGGIYLTGGIIPLLIKEIKESSFNERLLDKHLPTVKEIINNIPIYIIKRERPAIVGLSNKVLEIF